MRRPVFAFPLVIVFAPALAACTTLEPPVTDPQALARGEEGFNAFCARCHDPPRLGAPNRFALSRMTHSYIVSQLDKGKMQMMALDLTEQQVREIAAYLGK
jgi:mono/diheme cytochrome c family protein